MKTHKETVYINDVGFDVSYQVNPAEPDVGIMSSYIEIVDVECDDTFTWTTALEDTLISLIDVSDSDDGYGDYLYDRYRDEMLMREW